MKEIVDAIVRGKWFNGEDAPFKCSFTWDNPNLVIITGPNTCGKSVLRKIIHNRCGDANLMYVSCSQEGRTSSSGLQRLMMYGNENEDSTGYNSAKQLISCMKSIKKYDKPCVVMLDEPEIGCSEEVQAAIGERIADELSNMEAMPAVKCFFMVTHSRQVISHVMRAKPSHWRLADDGMTLDQFLNREIVPANLEALIEQGKKTWSVVNNLTRKN